MDDALFSLPVGQGGERSYPNSAARASGYYYQTAGCLGGEVHQGGAVGVEDAQRVDADLLERVKQQAHTRTEGEEGGLRLRLGYG